ncbi:MAG: hypothetical protein KAS95_05760, partial [Candidatus Heimdallarchaeota archaeon]|nr:hypothetical protein [Candidatus Heimdallarchaeota archaeon]
YSDDGSTAIEGVQISPYDLPGTDTLLMPENDYTITIYVRDLAGNTKADGVEFSLIDNLKPICYIILPENDSVDISGLMYFEVFAFDSSGINTEFLDLYFYSLTTDYWDVFQLGIDFEANYIETSNIFTFYFDSVKVPNDYYSIVVVVQDLAASENAQGSEILVTIDNELLIISGVLATDGRGGFFRRRGTLVFWLENPGTEKYNITEVEFSWEGNNRITFVYEMVDDTSGHTWLFSPGPYIENTAYDIDTDGVGVPVIPAELYGGAKHKISMLFDYGDKPTGVTFTISFHIVSDSVDVWVPFTLYL